MVLAESVRLQLFIEGVELPINSITVHAQINSPATATITMPPIPALRHIGPRAAVAVFFYDSEEESESEDRKWKLLYDGEIVGYSVSKSAMDRHFVFHCLDISNYWNTQKLYFFSGLDEASITERQNLVYGITQPTLSDAIPFLSLRNQIQSTIQESEGEPVDAINSLIRDGAFLNPFFMLALSRWSFLERVVSAEDLDISTLLTRASLGNIMGDLSGKFPADGSFLSLLQYILNLIYYQYVPITTPNLVEAAGPSIPGVSEVSAQLTSFFFKPHTMLSTPPWCNVLFPDQFHDMNFSRNYLAEPTRLRLSTDPFLFNGALSWNAHITGGEYLELDDNLIRELDLIYTSSDKGFQSHVYLTKEEQVKGIFPGFSVQRSPIYSDISHLVKFDDDETETEDADGNKIRYTTFRRRDKKPKTNMKRDSDEAIPIKTYLRGVADYEYRLQRHRPRITPVSMPFNPYLLLGFPCLLLDPIYPTLGEIQSISHVVIADGSAETQVQLGFCREATSNEETLSFWPAWINRDYRPDTAGSIYQQYWGVPSLVDVALEIDPTIRSENHLATKVILEDYAKGSEEERQKAILRGRRKIVTRRKYFQFLGAEENGGNYENLEAVAAMDETVDGEPMYLKIQREAWQPFEQLRSAYQQGPQQPATATFRIKDKPINVQISTQNYQTAKADMMNKLSASIGPFTIQNRSVASEVQDILEEDAFTDQGGELDEGRLSITEGNPDMPLTEVTPVTPGEDKSGAPNAFSPVGTSIGNMTAQLYKIPGVPINEAVSELENV